MATSSWLSPSAFPSAPRPSFTLSRKPTRRSCPSRQRPCAARPCSRRGDFEALLDSQKQAARAIAGAEAEAPDGRRGRRDLDRVRPVALLKAVLLPLGPRLAHA